MKLTNETEDYLINELTAQLYDNLIYIQCDYVHTI